MKVVWLPTFFLIINLGGQKIRYINNLSPGHSTGQGGKHHEDSDFQYCGG